MDNAAWSSPNDTTPSFAGNPLVYTSFMFIFVAGRALAAAHPIFAATMLAVGISSVVHHSNYTDATLIADRLCIALHILCAWTHSTTYVCVRDLCIITIIYAISRHFTRRHQPRKACHVHIVLHVIVALSSYMIILNA